jgi:hypothetical protein
MRSDPPGTGDRVDDGRRGESIVVPNDAPAAKAPSIAAPTRAARWSLHRVPPMRYQEPYVWFVFVSSLDIMLTWTIINRGGSEVNPIAKIVIDRWDLAGAVAFKFSLMLFVILVCEWVGRQRDHVGRRLVALAVLISAFPVVWSLVLLAGHSFGWLPE